MLVIITKCHYDLLLLRVFSLKDQSSSTQHSLSSVVYTLRRVAGGGRGAAGGQQGAVGLSMGTQVQGLCSPERLDEIDALLSKLVADRPQAALPAVAPGETARLIPGVGECKG